MKRLMSGQVGLSLGIRVGLVAQLVRALHSHCKGQRFDSSRVHKFDFWSEAGYSIIMEPVSADLPTPSSSTVPPTLPEPTNRSRHPRKRLVILLLIFFGLVISSVAGFYIWKAKTALKKNYYLTPKIGIVNLLNHQFSRFTSPHHH